jgi:cytosine deaminase
MKTWLVPAYMLLASCLMSLAWLGHLRFRDSVGFWTALALSWMLVLPEYVLNVAATRWGYDTYSGAQMATFHLAFGVVCVALVSRFVLGERLTPVQICGFVLLVVATLLITHEPGSRQVRKPGGGLARVAGTMTERSTERTENERMDLALEQARKSYDEGGLPIGAVMVEDGEVIAAGHNRRVQDGDPTSHGEMDCLRRAGRRPRYDGVTLYTTLSPCMMCAGTVVQFGIPRVVIGEDVNFPGNPDFLRQHGVEVILLDHAGCKELMSKFISERPELWDEDIAGRTDV